MARAWALIMDLYSAVASFTSRHSGSRMADLNGLLSWLGSSTLRLAGEGSGDLVPTGLVTAASLSGVLSRGRLSPTTRLPVEPLCRVGGRVGGYLGVLVARGVAWVLGGSVYIG